MKSPAALKEFIGTNKGAIYRFMLSKLKLGIQDNQDEVTLFKLGYTNRVAKIKKVDFEKTLNDMIAYFVQTEEYETAVQCRTLLSKHYVNRVVDETK